jgi:hypothetical protein
MKLQNLLPFEKYNLTTKLSYDEIYKRLADNIEPKRSFQFFAFNRNSTKPYEGEIWGNSFTISRIINYNNSFLPVIKGNILTMIGQNQINIKMRPAIFFLIFGSLWLGIVTLACILLILAGLVQFKQIIQNGFSPAFLIPFGMFIFGCLIFLIPFKIESKKSRKFLAALLEVEETD